MATPRKSILWQEISLIGNKQAEKVPCGMVVAVKLLSAVKKQRPNPYVAVGVDTQSGKLSGDNSIMSDKLKIKKFIRGQFCYA